MQKITQDSKIQQYIQKIKRSALLAWQGKENLNIVLWAWGIFPYVICYFLIYNIISYLDLRFFDIIISIPVVAYFIWHIMIVRRCSPKKKKINKKAEKEKFKKLSKKEQREIKAQKARELRKERIDKYILLRKPIGNFKLSTVVIVTDLYIIVFYSNYIIG